MKKNLYFSVFLVITTLYINASPYPREAEDFILKHTIQPNDLIFDIGAFKGEKIDIYLSYKARVIAFEPHPTSSESLKKKYMSNPNVTIESIALGEKEEIQTMYLSSKTPNLSTLSYQFTKEGRFADRSYTWETKATIQVSTLAKMIEKYGIPVFCKIDVENFEYEVIKGLENKIPKIISFEFHSEFLEKAKRCIQELHKKGYKTFNYCIGSLTPRLSTWVTAEEVIKKLEEETNNPEWEWMWGAWGDVYGKC